MRNILFLSDNPTIMAGLTDYLSGKDWNFTFACSPGSGLGREINARDVAHIVSEFDLVISAHCKQVFPADLVSRLPCVNLHPGFNPDTRGWYPQSFALARGLKVGFTVHYMDEQIDHGRIIYRQEIEALADDTSETLYARILSAEVASFDMWLPDLVMGDPATFPPESEGNYHSKSDFAALCELDLNEVGTFSDFYNRLRATSFRPFRNAWFRDADGRKIFVRIDTERE